MNFFSEVWIMEYKQKTVIAAYINDDITITMYKGIIFSPMAYLLSDM